MLVSTHNVSLQAVEELVAAMGAQASELVPVPSWHYEEEGGPRSEMTLADALAKCYDIRCAVRAPCCLAGPSESHRVHKSRLPLLLGEPPQCVAATN